MTETVYTIDELIDALSKYDRNTRVMIGIDYSCGVDVSLIEKGTFIGDRYDLENDTISLW